MIRGLIMRLAILLVIVGIDAVTYLAVSTVQLAPLRAAQAETQRRFGSDIVKLCQDASLPKSEVIPDVSKYVLIDTRHDTIYSDYNTAIPAYAQAIDINDVTVLVCLSEMQTVYALDTYGPDGSGYTCTRNRRDLKAVLINLQNHTQLGDSGIEGQIPPTCPDSTNSNLTMTGELPTPNMVIKWLLGSPDNQGSIT